MRPAKTAHRKKAAIPVHYQESGAKSVHNAEPAKSADMPTARNWSSKGSNLTFIMFFVVVAAASAMIIKPFFSILMISAVLAYIFYPAYEGFLQMFKRKGMAAGIVLLLLFLLVAAPMVLLVGMLTTESANSYRYVRDFIVQGKFETFCDDGNIGCTTYSYLKEKADKYGIDINKHLKDAALLLVTGLVKKVSDFVLNLPYIFLQLFFILFITYYFLKEGKDWLIHLQEKLPLADEVKEGMSRQFTDVMHATIYGAVVLSIIQGVVAAIGYYLLGVPAPILFGFITLIATFIPFIGGGLVWGPLAAYMLWQGISLGSITIIYQAIGLCLFGLFVISTIDNILKPKVVGDRAKMHPLVILLGVFGGLAVFGVMGILIGPLVLAIFLTALQTYERQAVL